MIDTCTGTRGLQGCLAYLHLTLRLGATERAQVRAAEARMQAAGGGEAALGDAAGFTPAMREVLARRGYAVWAEVGAAPDAPRQLVGHVICREPAPVVEPPQVSWPRVDFVVAAARKSKKGGPGRSVVTLTAVAGGPAARHAPAAPGTRAAPPPPH